MRNRTIQKQFWLNETEEKLLKEKSKKAGLSEAEFNRRIWPRKKEAWEYSG